MNMQEANAERSTFNSQRRMQNITVLAHAHARARARDR
jgi:hypothetical protein